jgi:hypothetical protein
MLSPLVCEQLKEEAEPRIAIAALQELRQLIDIQPLLTSVGEFLDQAESVWLWFRPIRQIKPCALA